MFLIVIGSLIAGFLNPLDPFRLFRVFVVVVVTAFALISLMFLLMVRVTDPCFPARCSRGAQHRALFPEQPSTRSRVPRLDAGHRGGGPAFTYAVHALKCLLLKNTGFGAIGSTFSCPSSRRSR